MKLSCCFISVLVTILTLFSTQSRAQYVVTPVKVPEAEMPEVKAAWDAVVKVEKTNNGFDFPTSANTTFICAWNSIIPPDNTTEYWIVTRNDDTMFIIPTYREATFNDLGVNKYGVPDAANAPYSCAAQATAMCDQGPSWQIPPCPPVCTLYTAACIEKCPPPKIADVSCTSTSTSSSSSTDFSGTCGCNDPPPAPPSGSSTVAMASWIYSLVFAAVVLMLL